MKWKDLRNYINKMDENQLEDPLALKIDDTIHFIPNANVIFRHDMNEIGCTQPYLDTGLTEEDFKL